MRAFLYPSPELDLPDSVFPLEARTVSVGRHPNNEISLLLESVSRFHAKLEQAGDTYVVTDLNSSNGTFVNSDKLSGPRRLEEGDTVTFGRAEFQFSLRVPGPKRPTEAPGEPTEDELINSDEDTSSISLICDDESSSVILTERSNIESPTQEMRRFIPELGMNIDDLKRVNSRLIALYNLNEVLRTSETEHEILEGMASLVFDALDADRLIVILAEDGQLQLDSRLVRYRSGKPDREVALSRTIVQKCFDQRVAILSRDARIDSRFSGSESIVASDIRSTICVPLISKRSTVGICFVDTRETIHVFDESDLAFLSSLCYDIAYAIDNMRLEADKLKNERLAAVGQTIAGLAHNIKNILQLAKGGMELMDAAVAKENFGDVTSFWPVVRRGIDRMQAMTQEMLEYSRQTKPDLVPANINEILTDIVDSFQRDRVESGVEILLELAHEVPIRKLDPDGLFKAIMNLLSNSVDAFEGAGGRVVIRTLCKDDTIRVEVEDNGRGIPKDKLARIFQPFFTTKGSKGTGLGLSMTRKYIEDMNGIMKVKSEEGRGTTFTLEFPPAIAHIETERSRDTDKPRATESAEATRTE